MQPRPGPFQSRVTRFETQHNDNLSPKLNIRKKQQIDRDVWLSETEYCSKQRDKYIKTVNDLENDTGSSFYW